MGKTLQAESWRDFKSRRARVAMKLGGRNTNLSTRRLVNKLKKRNNPISIDALNEMIGL